MRAASGFGRARRAWRLPSFALIALFLVGTQYCWLPVGSAAPPPACHACPEGSAHEAGSAPGADSRLLPCCTALERVTTTRLEAPTPAAALADLVPTPAVSPAPRVNRAPLPDERDAGPPGPSAPAPPHLRAPPRG